MISAAFISPAAAVIFTVPFFFARITAAAVPYHVFALFPVYGYSAHGEPEPVASNSPSPFTVKTTSVSKRK